MSSILSKEFEVEATKLSPRLTTLHIVKRFEKTIGNATSTQVPWYKTIRSDREKFNLDETDGFAYYWHDFLEEER